MAQNVEKKKAKVIDAFRETHIVTHACRKAGISTSAYYRWIAEDEVFRNECEVAREEGKMRLCDFAESNLVNAIRKGDISVSKYVLERHHPEYIPRLRARHEEPKRTLKDMMYGWTDLYREAKKVNKKAEDERKGEKREDTKA